MIMNALAKSVPSFALPEIGDEEIAEVVDTPKSGRVTTGPKARRFDAAVTDLPGSELALAVPEYWPAP